MTTDFETKLTQLITDAVNEIRDDDDPIGAVNFESIKTAKKHAALIEKHWTHFIGIHPAFAETRPYFDEDGRLIFDWQFGMECIVLVFDGDGQNKMLYGGEDDHGMTRTLLDEATK